MRKPKASISSPANSEKQVFSAGEDGGDGMIKVNLNKKQKKTRIKIDKKSIKSISGFVIIPIIAGVVAAEAMNLAITAKINAVNNNIKVYNGKTSALLSKVQKVNAIKKKQGRYSSKD
jgi:hypothetical protein